MSLIWADKVAETSTTTGTGALTLAGAITGYRAFSSVMTSPNDTCYYMITAVDANGVPTGDWEAGLGTYSASNTLTRTTVHASTNGGSAVSFSAGTKRVTLSKTARAAGQGWDFNPPLAASFSLMNSDGTNMTLADDSDVGLTVDSGAATTGTGNQTRAAYRTLTTPTSAFDLKVKLKGMFADTNFSSFGLIVHNSTNSRSLRIGVQDNEGLAIQRFSALGTYSATSNSFTLNDVTMVPDWFRIQWDGTTYTFQISVDGKLWVTVATQTAAAYLTASGGGNGDRVGFFVGITRTTGLNIPLNISYFSLTGAGV